jgi:hypothetical protein
MDVKIGLSHQGKSRLKVLENKVLRRIFVSKGGKGTVEWRKLHNEELHNLYSSPDIIMQVKSRKTRWARHNMACMRRRDKCTRFWLEGPKERDHSEDQGVDGRMASEWILGRLAGMCGLDYTGSG